jgi:hypothetical protein
VLEPGHFAFGMVADNYDRDPLGLDVFDVRMDFRVAVVRRLELYGRYQISRAVSSPGHDPVPSPPLDIVALKPAAAPRGPYRAIYWPMPYLSHHGSRADDFTPGEYTLGLKGLVTHQRGWRPAIATSLDVSIPGDTGSDPLQRGSGTGSTDVRFSSAGTWSHGRWSVSLNLGYTHSGAVERSDRLIVQGVNGAAQVTDEPIRRPGLLNLGLGARYAIRDGVSAFAELAGWEPIGSHTPTLYGSGATDLLAGVQIVVRGICLTAAYRQHLNPPPNGATQPTGPLGGALGLSLLSDAEQRSYLQSIGVDQQFHRPSANLVVVGTPVGIPDPTSSQRIPPTHVTHTTGNGGVVLALSFSF